MLKICETVDLANLNVSFVICLNIHDPKKSWLIRDCCLLLHYSRSIEMDLNTIALHRCKLVECISPVELSFKMRAVIVLLFVCYLNIIGISSQLPMKEAIDAEWNKLKSLLPVDPLKLNVVNQTWCTCGVFLSGQFKRGSTEPPKGHAALMHEQDLKYPCTTIGSKQCQNKCLETIAKHLPNSPAILCGSIDRDVYRERAYLFIQSCNGTWTNTNFSAGREFCCKDGSPYKCPNNFV